ncbi:MAG: ABC transporter ATP-binding protein/permease, partial [Campylobacteraceae bacterium]|nr:ABC transporter ATP-binding protein/permease [Campylobacteraceae bacterium]
KVASSFITAVLHMIFVAIILFYISWQMAVLIFLINPFVVFATRWLSKKIAILKKKQNESYENFQENLSETLNQYIQVRASNQEENFTKNLINSSDTLRETSTKFTYKRAGANAFSMALFMTTSDFLRVCAILMVALYNEMTIGQIMAVFSYLWMVVRPMESIVNIQYSYNSAKVALNRINTIFALQKEPQYSNMQNPFDKNATNSIKLENANFSYNKKDYVLQNINLEIKSGEKVAFVGKSGNGKTTLAQIIVGFYPLDSGELLFDDINIKDIGLNVVRENVFLILQNPQLFNDTIKYNLTLGNDIDEDKIWKALKIVQLYELIHNFPNKLETRVGNNGVKLSGGQRQRLTIARMILKNPNIIIFDESTSALDNTTEKRLFAQIEDFLKDKTTIIIAHRLSTIQNVDRIFLFDNGKIEVINSYEELLKKELEYE